MFAIFASQELGEHNRAKLLCLVLQVIKTFSPLDGVEDNVVKGCFDGTFELWMSMFISALQGSLNLNLSVKKYILKVSMKIGRFWWLSFGICKDMSISGNIKSPTIFLSSGSLLID